MSEQLHLYIPSSQFQTASQAHIMQHPQPSKGETPQTQREETLRRNTAERVVTRRPIGGLGRQDNIMAAESRNIHFSFFLINKRS